MKHRKFAYRSDDVEARVDLDGLMNRWGAEGYRLYNIKYYSTVKHQENIMKMPPRVDRIKLIWEKEIYE